MLSIYFSRLTRVMIIEDEQDLLNLYKDYLVSKGYIISVTNTTAISIMNDFNDFKPDILILDYKLPDDKTGIQAAKEIFQTSSTVGIIIITAYDSIRNNFYEDRDFESKKIKLLIKPFKLSELNKTIQQLLN